MPVCRGYDLASALPGAVRAGRVLERVGHDLVRSGHAPKNSRRGFMSGGHALVSPGHGPGCEGLKLVCAARALVSSGHGAEHLERQRQEKMPSSETEGQAVANAALVHDVPTKHEVTWPICLSLK